MTGLSRRQVLRASGAAGIVASAGCLRLTEGERDVSGSTPQPTGGTSTPTPAAGVEASSGWETSTDGDASADVLGPTDLDFRVFKCATAFATREYEARSSEVTVSFDYEVEAEEWFEAPYLVVRDDGGVAYESQNKGVEDKTFEVESYATTSGSFERTVSVDGPFVIEVGLKPSDYCSAGDHANTYFRIENFGVE